MPGAPRRADFVDMLRVIATVLTPTIAKGVIKRRPSMVAFAQRRDLDTKAVRLMQRLRKKYGSDPLLLSLPFRSQLLLLNPADVAEVLAATPVPFTPATREKRSALDHFEPGNVLISDPPRRAELRPVHEAALATGKKIHPFAQRFDDIVRQELESMIARTDQTTSELDWSEFSATWFRIVRRIVLGDAARDDVGFTDLLDDLRRRANWAFATVANRSKLGEFEERMCGYLNRREAGSLVSRLPDREGLELQSQVAQWLFAFDAAGIASFRALAVLACRPDYQASVASEAAISSLDRPFTRGCFLEAVRLWPTTPAILRELTEKHEMAGRSVDKGTGVIIFAPFFHRDTERLAFANRMAPEIWDGADENLPLSGLVPFSAGAAICPAHNLVPLVASLLLANLLSACQLSLPQPRLDPENLPGTLDYSGIRLRLVGRARAE